MDTIVDILTGAGYERARMEALSEFDKIIGGLAWAVEALIYEMEISVFFADQLDLGQKIALTERVVMVLLAMNCPHQIEPHQIVGLDYQNIVPVVRWLVERIGEQRRAASKGRPAFNRYPALRDMFPQVSARPPLASEDERADGGHSSAAALEERQPEVAVVEAPPPSESAGLSEEEAVAGTVQPLSEACRAEPDEKGPAQPLERELDTELLATNQKILQLLKRLDSMPSQLERQQYRRRFVELHQQLISKNKDVKKLFTLYNSLDGVKHYLTKEISLFDSVQSNFELTKNSPTNRELLITQLKDIIEKVAVVRDELTANLERLHLKCDLLNTEYASLS